MYTSSCSTEKVAGSTISAYFAVSVINLSCTTVNKSSLISPFIILFWLLIEPIGFDAYTNKLFIGLFSSTNADETWFIFITLALFVLKSGLVIMSFLI